MAGGHMIFGVFCGVAGNYGHSFTNEDITDFVQKCSDAGINRLLPSFQTTVTQDRSVRVSVQVHKQWTRPYQPYEFGPNSPLVLMVQRAHSLGLDVMSYFAVGVHGGRIGIDSSNVDEPWPIRNSNTLVEEHPEYWTHTRDGSCWLDYSYRSPLGKAGYASLAYPEVRAAEREMVLDQVEAGGVDGVQLEFLASPRPAYDRNRERGHTIDYCLDERGYWAYGYDPPALDAFQERYGEEPRELDSADDRWVRFRSSYVTQLLREIRAALGQRKVELSVQGVSGTFSSPAAGRRVNVDWETWVDEGLVDTIYPRYPAHYPKLKLAYDDDTVRHITEEVGELKRSLAGRARLIAGLLLPSYSFLTRELVTVEEAGKALWRGVEAALAGGAEGIAIYRADRIEALGLWPTVAEITRAYA